ncbi:Maf-like protein YceF [Vibrio ruber DSM 16370]|uniref:7-methyl-GTP pyrophosphatase n=1 Tax=Vibrio ruber (strain DSM 16370 / JCM 11486 / BCRC 17186 / CECT 7878 / LMG 23124 / VR1) TaxID=1123498 RepID=A0A1R4LG48_VIBR1|nr:nucleoside triphosphate pyrophosphatase [Vibrio ruber]SJN55413.1 Maf-like protein YceF [Vibrio ruber DSM 16370]
MSHYQLVLASTSKYRRQLLEKIAIPFISMAPECDETPFADESPQALVQRLARQKAQSCPPRHQPSLVIGSDQVCVVQGQIVGKPHTKERAVQQLTAQSGNKITFYTGLAVYNNVTRTTQSIVDQFHVHFRQLTPGQIERYIEIEQPLDCAGSFKSEGLGIALFERLEGDDPNALIGLPLIKLIDLLDAEGMTVL